MSFSKCYVTNRVLLREWKVTIDGTGLWGLISGAQLYHTRVIWSPGMEKVVYEIIKLTVTSHHTMDFCLDYDCSPCLVTFFAIVASRRVRVASQQCGP